MRRTLSTFTLGVHSTHTGNTGVKRRALDPNYRGKVDRVVNRRTEAGMVSGRQKDRLKRDTTGKQNQSLEATAHPATHENQPGKALKMQIPALALCLWTFFWR